MVNREYNTPFLFPELKRYLEQLKALNSNKDDYREECFINIRNFYERKIKYYNRLIVKTFGKQELEELENSNQPLGITYKEALELFNKIKL